MVSDAEFVRSSLELHLFFTRIMKEHAFFLQLGFTPKDSYYSQTADTLRKDFEGLLADVITLSNGVVSTTMIDSGELITPFTKQAEVASSYYSGVPINTELTQKEAVLKPGIMKNVNERLVQTVYGINKKALELVSALIEFKSFLITNVSNCNLFINMYPLMLDHILQEAKEYFEKLKKIQSMEALDLQNQVAEQELFWDNIMSEHAKFIRGMLDPTEKEPINTANDFVYDYAQVMMDINQAVRTNKTLERETEVSYLTTKDFRDFKEQGTKGILECKLKSIIIPLLADHVLREANYYLRLFLYF